MDRIEISKDSAKPYYASPGAAGADLRAKTAVTIQPGERVAIKTGVIIALPENMAAMVMGRSGNTMRLGLHVLLGLIDSDYRGEISVMAHNISDSVININAGDRIGQLVIIEAKQYKFAPMKSISETKRGSNGFGSTGK